MAGHNPTMWSFQGRKVSDFARDSSGCRHKFAENRDGLYCVYCGETIYSAPNPKNPRYRKIIREGRANESMEVPAIKETTQDNYIKIRVRMKP